MCALSTDIGIVFYKYTSTQKHIILTLVLCLQMHKIQKYRYCTFANTQPQAFLNWSTGTISTPPSTYIYAIIAQTIKILHEIELWTPISKIKQHLVKDVHSIAEKLSFPNWNDVDVWHTEGVITNFTPPLL